MKRKVKTLYLKVENITCRLCEKAIRSSLRGVEGINGTYISVKEKLIMIQYDVSKVSESYLETLIENTGFNIIFNN